MDQLAMFKKDQGDASNKNEVDKYLSQTKIIGLTEDIKVKNTRKYVLTTLPANLNPSYNVLAIEINKKYLEETLDKNISAALVIAIQEGEKTLSGMAKED